ncbi:MAG: outer membrane protein assembly factor BamE [Deltaproteobacteria bacterium]|nr:outer membrane protein assembly factor BamE [Deltaproteobacteria bacterium]
MLDRLKTILVFFTMLSVSACVATGTRQITKSGTVNRLEPGKSTKAEVTSLLGFPALVSYGPKGGETWDYYYVTEYPQAADFVPVAVAYANALQQSTRGLTITFDRQGLVQNLQKRLTTGKSENYPY